MTASEKLPERIEMKSRGIIFSGADVRAVQEGRKTQTRRIIKPQPHDDCGVIHVGKFHPEQFSDDGEYYPGKPHYGAYSDDGEWGCKCPYGQPGDRLWVRETWADVRRMGFDRDLFPTGAAYKSDCEGQDSLDVAADYGVKWKPSIHLPRWASRITLEIDEIRVERLNDISEEDAIAEGFDSSTLGTGAASFTGHARYWYKQLWNSIHGPVLWTLNPWVFVLKFRRINNAD